jgi:hypothetical protein
LVTRFKVHHGSVADQLSDVLLDVHLGYVTRGAAMARTWTALVT